ncbi:MAG: ribonuclease T [Wenzhouxiangellaceae bacterium]
MIEMKSRFRGFLPVVVDVETGGFNPATDALLEIAACIIEMDDQGRLYPGEMISRHIEPFEGANIEAAALEFNGIRPDHPLRLAQPESRALPEIFKPIRRRIRETGCTRAILVGHNPTFDLSFLNAAVERIGYKRNPFHPFSSFDTATLGGLAYGQTVLARAVQAAGLDWDPDEAHSARYDAERTAQLFCRIVNRWSELGGLNPATLKNCTTDHG